MVRWKLIAGVLLIFLTGVLVGSIGTGYGIGYFFDRFKKDSQYRINFILGTLSRRLDLDKEQKEKIRTILTQADKEICQFWVKVLNNADQLVEKTKVKIRKELTPEQVKKYEEFSPQVNVPIEDSSGLLLKPAWAQEGP